MQDSCLKEFFYGKLFDKIFLSVIIRRWLSWCPNLTSLNWLKLIKKVISSKLPPWYVIYQLIIAVFYNFSLKVLTSERIWWPTTFYFILKRLLRYVYKTLWNQLVTTPSSIAFSAIGVQYYCSRFIYSAMCSLSTKWCITVAISWAKATSTERTNGARIDNITFIRFIFAIQSRIYLCGRDYENCAAWIVSLGL